MTMKDESARELKRLHSVARRRACHAMDCSESWPIQLPSHTPRRGRIRFEVREPRASFLMPERQQIIWDDDHGRSMYVR